MVRKGSDDVFHKYPNMPKATAKRLSIYHQYVKMLADNEVERISSTEMSHDLKIEAATLRRDLSHIGSLGKQGYGYHVQSLVIVLNNLFMTNRSHLIAVIGVSQRGRRFFNHRSLTEKNMTISCAFTETEHAVGTIHEGVPIYSITDFTEVMLEKNISTLVLDCSEQEWHTIEKQVGTTAVTTILNLSVMTPQIPSSIVMRSFDVVSELQTLFAFEDRLHENKEAQAD